MKANEIMPGDWLHLHYCNRFDGEVHKNFRVEQIRDDYGDMCVWAKKSNGHSQNMGELEPKFGKSNISPIPITPEILEKNGFEKRNNYQWEYCDENCKIAISIAPQIEIDGEILGPPPVNVEIEGALFELNKTDDWYIHELQHALRLCGIEKEIVL